MRVQVDDPLDGPLGDAECRHRRCRLLGRGGVERDLSAELVAVQLRFFLLADKIANNLHDFVTVPHVEGADGQRKAKVLCGSHGDFHAAGDRRVERVSVRSDAPDVAIGVIHEEGGANDAQPQALGGNKGLNFAPLRAKDAPGRRCLAIPEIKPWLHCV